uniref:Ragulator complex protein LAMTOR1 n=1 Tax=Bos taurus TaxID=9913 RepID=A0A3Q1LJE8_BOVIN
MGCCYSSENEDSDQDREERKLLLDPSSPPTKALNGAEPNYHSLPSARTDEQALLSSILAKTARWASQDWAWDSAPPSMLKTGMGGQTQDAGDRSVGRGTPGPSRAPVGRQGHDCQIGFELSPGRESVQPTRKHFSRALSPFPEATSLMCLLQTPRAWSSTSTWTGLGSTGELPAAWSLRPLGPPSASLSSSCGAWAPVQAPGLGVAQEGGHKSLGCLS